MMHLPMRARSSAIQRGGGGGGIDIEEVGSVLLARTGETRKCLQLVAPAPLVPTRQNEGIKRFGPGLGLSLVDIVEAAAGELLAIWRW
jgi:hypothetical protein